MKFLSQDNKQAFRNPWVIGWISAILLVIAVNVVFIFTAAITNPGLVEADYYEKGQDHEKNFRSKQAMANELGWQMSLGTCQPGNSGRTCHLHFQRGKQCGCPGCR